VNRACDAAFDERADNRVAAALEIEGGAGTIDDAGSLDRLRLRCAACNEIYLDDLISNPVGGDAVGVEDELAEAICGFYVLSNGGRDAMAVDIPEGAQVADETAALGFRHLQAD
jgi:hypothetical protein